MNLKHKVFSFAAASIFALSLGGTAMAAQENNKVEQEIKAGAFTAYVGGGTLAAVGYSHDQRTNHGDLTLHVDDLRGTYAGWNVTISSSAFIYGGNAVTETAGEWNIPASNFLLKQTEAPDLEEGQAVGGGIKGATNGTLNTAQTPITADAGFGAGSYTQNLPVALTIPADSPAGTYTATLTVESSAFPSNE